MLGAPWRIASRVPARWYLLLEVLLVVLVPVSAGVGVSPGVILLPCVLAVVVLLHRGPGLAGELRSLGSGANTGLATVRVLGRTLEVGAAVGVLAILAGVFLSLFGGLLLGAGGGDVEAARLGLKYFITFGFLYAFAIVALVGVVVVRLLVTAVDSLRQ